MYLCQHGNIDIVKYLLLEYNCVNPLSFVKSIEYDRYDVAKLLVESKIIVTDESIIEIPYISNNYKYIKLLIDNGYNPTYMAKLIVDNDYNKKHNRDYYLIQTLSHLINFGINLNEIIISNCNI